MISAIAASRRPCLRYVELNNLQPAIEARRKELAQIAKPTLDDYKRLCDQQTLDLVASFQRAVVDDLVSKTLTAAEAFDAATLLVTGGVAANSELRETFEREGTPGGHHGVLPFTTALHR